MCARIVQNVDTATVAKLYDTAAPAVRATDQPPTWNGTPGRAYLLCRDAGHGAGRELRRLRWGLHPRWSRDRGFAPVNARSETVATKPTFAEAFRLRRCVLPVNGWYEWRRTGGPRTPHYIRAADGGLLHLAAIWEPPAGGSEPATFAVLTTEPQEVVRRIHRRQPSLLDDPGVVLRWLDPQAGLHEAGEIARLHGQRALRTDPVGDAINNPRNDGADLILPLAAA